MKRAKDKYMINRTKYKGIKRYDHKQMEDFLTDVYKNGYADGKESVPGVELQDVEKALQDVKGIGPVVWNRIKERLAELFRKEQVAMGVTFAVTNTLEAQKPKAEAQPQAQGINPAALLAAMFANAANQQPRDDTGNESDDDE